MPALGMAQETGKLISWLKREGESVTRGEPIMEVETDKVNVQIEAPATGILGSLSAREGDVIPVGKTIAWILAPGESPPAESVAPPATVTTTASLKALPPPASPKARRLAAERGIDVAGLTGSGPDGAVLATDLPDVSAPDGTQTLSSAWKIMADRVTKSWTQIPHFYLTREVAAGGLVELRGKISPSVEARTGVKLTYTDILVKLVAAKIRAHPQINAGWRDGTIHWNKEIHIGIATAIEEGLVVPVIHNADQQSLSEIAAQRKDLVDRAHVGKLRPQDVVGGTFTITNLGMYKVDAFNAIINPPQAAILAVGRIADRVVAVEGQPQVRPMMIFTLSFDHRVVDGAGGARFLDDLANFVEEPWALLA